MVVYNLYWSFQLSMWSLQSKFPSPRDFISLIPPLLLLLIPPLLLLLNPPLLLSHQVACTKMLSASSSPSPAERQPGLIGDAVRLPAKQAGIASPDVEIASEQKINAAQADAEALCTAKALLKWEKTLRVFMVVAIVLALLLTAVMAAAVYVVADAKETTLHDGVLRSKETEEVIKTASADFEVVDGVLVARGAGKDEHRQVVQTAQVRHHHLIHHVIII